MRASAVVVVLGFLLCAPSGASEPAPDARLEVQYAWLFGRPDLVEDRLGFTADEAAARLGSADGGVDPIDVWPILLRDLWWRPVDEATRWQRRQLLAWALQRLEQEASPAIRLPYQWLREGSSARFPAPPIAEDPWPVLTTLVLDRQRREATGPVGYPEESPLATRPPPAAWTAWWDDWLEDYQRMTVQRAYQGDDLSMWPADERAPEETLDRKATVLRGRNQTIAVLAVLALVAVGALLAWRLGPRRK